MSGRASSGYVNSIRHTFPAHIPLYVCTIFSLTVITAILAAYDATPRFAAGWAILAIFLIFIGAVTAFAMLREVLLLAREGFSGNAVQSIGVRLAARFHEKDRIGNIFHSVVSLFPLLMGFTVLKGAIAFIHPFAWDMRLSELDAAIGFGTHPWQLLQPFLGYAPITIFLSCVYYLWFPVLFTSLAGQAFSRHGTVLRMQFLIAFTLAFFVSGCILALIFSSAGPCYYAHLHLGGDPYAAQLLYLRSIGPERSSFRHRAKRVVEGFCHRLFRGRHFRDAQHACDGRCPDRAARMAQGRAFWLRPSRIRGVGDVGVCASGMALRLRQHRRLGNGAAILVCGGQDRRSLESISRAIRASRPDIPSARNTVRYGNVKAASLRIA